MSDSTRGIQNSFSDEGRKPDILSKKCIAVVYPQETPYDPYEHRIVFKPSTYFGGFANLLKSAIGSGIMAMPMAFKNSGLATGVVLTVLIALLCNHCCRILVSSSYKLCSRAKIPTLDFPKTAELAFRMGPKQFRGGARYAGLIVTIGMFFSYWGTCCVYVVFVSTSTDQLARNYSSFIIDKRAYMAAFTIFFMVASFIKELKYLIPFSVIADTFIVASITIGVYYFAQDLPSPSTAKQFASFQTLPLFFGTVIFALDNVGIVLPIENNLKQPKQMNATFGLLNMLITILIVLYSSVGFTGFLKFGENTQSNFILNLPSDEMAGRICKIIIVIAISLTYPIQFFMPMTLFWQMVRNNFSPKRHYYVEPLLRIIMVCVITAFAMAIPDLGAIIDLLGALFLSTLGFLVPVIIQTLTEWGENGICFPFWFWKNLLISAFWLVALLSGCYASIKEIILAYS